MVALGLPFRDDDEVDHQQSFAVFGFPHIHTLVTEVATRTLRWRVIRSSTSTDVDVRKGSLHLSRGATRSLRVRRTELQSTSTARSATTRVVCFDGIRSHNVAQNTTTDSLEVRREDKSAPIPEPIPRSEDFSPTRASFSGVSHHLCATRICVSLNSFYEKLCVLCFFH